MTTTLNDNEAPDEISTGLENTMAIAREINKIHRWERYRKLMPAVAKLLTDAGVDFSKATIPSDVEVEAAINTAMEAE